MATTEVERLVVTLEARMGGFEAEMRRGNQLVNKRLGQMEQRFAMFARNLKSSTSAAALGVGSALAGIGGYLGVQQLQQYADGWTTVNRALQASEQSFGVRLRSASELNKLSNEARVDLEAFTKLYTRTAGATRELGIEEEKVAKVTSTVAMALKLGSATAEEQASTMLQLSQAFNKGKLDGDEFRAVMENAVIIQELLADRLKVSKGEIIKMAAEGKLRIGDLIGALSDGGEKVERLFKKLPATIGEAFTVLRNSMIEYVGKADQAYGVSKSLTDALGAMARNMDVAGNAAVTLGAALLATFGGGTLRALLAVAARLASIPALLAAGSAAALTFGQDAALNLDIFNQRLAQGADLATAMHGALSDGANGATTVADQFRALGTVIGSDLMSAVDTISVALTGGVISWDQMRGAALIAVGAIIGGVKGLYHNLKASLTAIPALGEMAFKALANKVLAAMQFVIDKVVAGINAIKRAVEKLPFVFKEPDFAAPQLGEFDYSDAAARLEEAARKLDKELAADFDLPAFSMRVQDVANGIAFDRLKAGFAPLDPITPKAVNPSSPDSKKRRSNPFEREVRQVEEHIAALKLESEMLGKSAYETERARTEMELLNAAKQAGIKITPELLAQIDQLSMAYAKAKTEAEQLRETFEDMKALSGDILKGFISDLKEGKSGTEALANGLNKIADKLIDMAVNQLVDRALGPLLGAALGGMGGNAGLGSWAASVTPAAGFASGGYTGQGGKHQPAGIVHKGEYVFDQDAVRRIGVGNLQKLHQNAGQITAAAQSFRMPAIAAASPAGQSGGVVTVKVAASSEFEAMVEQTSGRVAAETVRRTAPSIVGESVKQTQKNLKGMAARMQKREG